METPCCLKTTCCPEKTNTKTSVTEFATQVWETQQNYNSSFSNTVQIAEFYEIHHSLANITALLAAV